MAESVSTTAATATQGSARKQYVIMHTVVPKRMIPIPKENQIAPAVPGALPVTQMAPLDSWHYGDVVTREDLCMVEDSWDNEERLLRLGAIAPVESFEAQTARESRRSQLEREHAAQELQVGVRGRG